jgi:hypothetical protein
MGLARGALRDLASFSRLSVLPDGLGDWSGERFVTIEPKGKLPDEAVMRDRIGHAVDRIIAKGSEIRGPDLLWSAVAAIVGEGGFRARVMKPNSTFAVEHESIERMRKWSGGEKVTASLLLFVTVARLRATNRARKLAGAGVLVLDNPLGKANYVPFLTLQRRVAARVGIQLVFLSVVADLKAVGRFPNIVRMRNAPDRRLRRDYVEVEDRDQRGDGAEGVVDATRVHRTDEPSLELV